MTLPSLPAAGWRSIASARRMSPPERVAQWPREAPETTARRTLDAITERWPSGVAWSRVQWTLSLVGLLGYTYVIVSLRAPVGTVMMVVAIVGLFLSRERIRIPAPVLWFTALLAWGAVCLPFSPFPAVAQDSWVEFAKVWCVAVVAGSALRSWARIRLYMVFLLVCFVLYPVRGTLFNYYIYHNTVFGRAIWNGVFSNPNDLAGIALLQVSMAAALLSAERSRWIRYGAIAACLLLPFVIALTQSRGAFIAFGGALALSITVHRRRLRILGIVAVALVLIVMVAPTSAFERLQGLRNATDASNLKAVDPEGSADQRYEIWRIASSIIRDYPLTGVGTGAYKYAHFRYSLRDGFRLTGRGYRDTHSTYLNTAAENGIPGLLMFLFLIGQTMWRTVRVRKRCEHVLPAEAAQLFWLQQGLFAFLLAGLFGTYVRFPLLYIHLILMWSLAELADHELSRVLGPRAMPQRDTPNAARASVQHRRMGGHS